MEFSISKLISNFNNDINDISSALGINNTNLKFDIGIFFDKTINKIVNFNPEELNNLTPMEYMYEIGEPIIVESVNNNLNVLDQAKKTNEFVIFEKNCEK
ncbi:MAG: hypothetical protein LBH55_00890 [Mycoplasmataceae bacterium]|jgi:hypothetical protein|nr:hypothetical protein [Mycoplasmataceae bacterium]